MAGVAERLHHARDRAVGDRLVGQVATPHVVLLDQLVRLPEDPEIGRRVRRHGLRSDTTGLRLLAATGDGPERAALADKYTEGEDDDQQQQAGDGHCRPALRGYGLDGRRPAWFGGARELVHRRPILPCGRNIWMRRG